MSEQITLTIDGKTVSAAKGATIWQAAKDAGIFVPIYCYHPKMPPLGACRICMVEVEKMPKPMAACTTQVSEGMVVHTESKLASDARSGVMEFLLINHPLDCPICDKGGECDLQNYAVEFGQGTGRFHEHKRHLDKAVELGPTIVLDRERCIMCQRCARFSQLIVQDEGLIIAERGAKAEISTVPGKAYDSQFSGNTVEMCPVGALTARTYRFKARPWELRHSASVCAHCSVGCNITIDTRLSREVVRFMSRDNEAVDDGWLCDRGRYGYGFIHNRERLKSPHVRNANGKLEAVTWQQAFDYLAKRLGEIIKANGAQSVAVLPGSHATNEEIFTLQRFALETIGTDKLVYRGGNFGKYATADLPQYLTATIAGMEKAAAILVVGADISARQPILELRLKKAHRNGTKLLFLGGNPGALSRYATKIETVETGKLAQTVEQLLRKPNSDIMSTLKAAGEVAIWFDEADTLAPGNEKLFEMLVQLAQATGSFGKPGVGLGALSQDNNSVGARNISAVAKSSLSYSGFLRGEGNLKAAMVMGTNPLTDIALYGGKAESLTGLELLVVQEMFMSETAQLAHVVLPVASFAEIEGTFTNLEGRVQKIEPAIPPITGTAPNIAIIYEMSSRLGKALPALSIADIFSEITKTIPAFAGLTYEALGEQGIISGRAELASKSL
ncbi:MAG: NADH-quinone oxidoreductase subunit NuoG [Chloroflexi bacterium]|uniref:NADH-quinone oxidoreductase subunit NuoG n=1 Tax=Candidatus Chlorohelix allophototropha TaxID=3003348 RepID=A0A8T7M1C8_9CHLR|nr:NADH-quinone oxidoreductase subunit NuoG [Chloroflexota bacterium]WJW67723.1 NADH-quinone oxidoreductase subunit NuoG [Chloroflexota bacterium L227-S17]